MPQTCVLDVWRFFPQIGWKETKTWSKCQFWLDLEDIAVLLQHFGQNTAAICWKLMKNILKTVLSRESCKSWLYAPEILICQQFFPAGQATDTVLAQAPKLTTFMIFLLILPFTVQNLKRKAWQPKMCSRLCKCICTPLKFWTSAHMVVIEYFFISNLGDLSDKNIVVL